MFPYPLEVNRVSYGETTY